MDFLTILIGLVVGIAVGATSTGGGALLTPALILLANVPASIAIGSDVMIASCMKFFGGSIYALRGEVHWKTVTRLASGSIPGAIVGIWILNRMPLHVIDSYLTRGLGLVLIVAGVSVILRLRSNDNFNQRNNPGYGVTAFLGFITGVLVSMTSIGSGSLLLCVLSLYFPLRSTTIVGTDLVHALFLSSVATVGHSMAGRLDLALAGAVLVGAIPGVIIGTRVATALPERKLRTVLAAILVVIGLQLSIFTNLVAENEPLALESQEDKNVE
tara:strand:+ start:9627 stop:10439 length:813 start_codon:yes stop_codon:yes gene_type:complete